jgi:trigger factor
MKFTLEKGQKSFERKLLVTVPAAEIETELHSQIVEYSKRASLPGFRPGKVTPKVIAERFGKALRQDAIQKSIEKYYQEILKTEKINPTNQATIEMIKDVVGEDVEFSASFEVIPEVTLKGLEGLAIDKKSSSVTDADVEEVLARMQKQHAEYHVSDKSAKNEDRVTIDFEGSINGEVFKGGTAKDFKVILGSGQMIPGFEGGLLGVKEEDSRDLEVTFPAEYHSPDLAGKPAVFKVNVNKVESPTLPELDDKFAAQYNVFTMDDLRKEVRQNMTRELNAKLKGDLKNQIIEALLALNEVEVSPSLVDQEAKMLAYQAAQQAGLVDQKTGKMKMNVPTELFKEAAEKRVRSGILMIRLIEKFEVKADKASVDAALDEFVQVFEDKEAVKRDYQSKPDQMMNFHQQVLEDKVIEKLLELGKVTEKTLPFFEVIDKTQLV